MIVVSNSSPLVYLAALSDIELLPKLFGKILIPPAVWREVVDQAEGLPVCAAVEGALGKWLEVVPLKNLCRSKRCKAADFMPARPK